MTRYLDLWFGAEPDVKCNGEEAGTAAGERRAPSGLGRRRRPQVMRLEYFTHMTYFLSEARSFRMQALIHFWNARDC